MLNFKNWILKEETQGSFSWDGQSWGKEYLGDRTKISVYIDNKVRLDVGPRHPNIKKAIKILVKQKPEVINKPIEFDGFSPGTVRDYLYNPEYHDDKNLLPKYLYTGTSLYRWEKIKEMGLAPRVVTHEEPVHGAQISSALPANPNYVYLSGSPGNTVKFAGRDASKDGSSSVILQIDTNGLKYNKLKPDEDSWAGTWQGSLHKLNTVAYEGIILPKYIKLYKAINPQTNKWEDPGEFLEPKDWLAKQFKNIGKEPKWIKPNEHFIESVQNIMTSNEIFNYIKDLHPYEEDLYEGDLRDRIFKYKFYSLQEVPINKIKGNWQTYEKTIEDYKKEYLNKKNYPPIVLQHNLIIIDGIHRYEALKQLRNKFILAYVGEK